MKTIIISALILASCSTTGNIKEGSAMKAEQIHQGSLASPDGRIVSNGNQAEIQRESDASIKYRQQVNVVSIVLSRTEAVLSDVNQYNLAHGSKTILKADRCAIGVMTATDDRAGKVDVVRYEGRLVTRVTLDFVSAYNNALSCQDILQAQMDSAEDSLKLSNVESNVDVAKIRARLDSSGNYNVTSDDSH